MTLLKKGDDFHEWISFEYLFYDKSPTVGNITTLESG